MQYIITFDWVLSFSQAFFFLPIFEELSSFFLQSSLFHFMEVKKGLLVENRIFFVVLSQDRLKLNYAKCTKKSKIN